MLEDQKTELNMFGSMLVEYEKRVKEDCSHSEQEEKNKQINTFRDRYTEIFKNYLTDKVRVLELDSNEYKEYYKNFLEKHPDQHKRLNELDPNFKIQGDLVRV